METRRPLTEWEVKERAGLLALETEEWREKRLIAEDPNTTAEALDWLFQEALTFWYNNTHEDKIDERPQLLAAALAAHPNTPPSTLAGLVSGSYLLAYPFCHNPITPFLLLEQPGFIADLAEYDQHELLREADAPPLFVQMLATGGAAKNKAVRIAAKLHVTVAGEVETVTEAKGQLGAYFRPRHDATPEMQDAEFLQWLNDPKEQASREDWAYRFEAVLLVDAPDTVLVSDVFKRTGRDLLDHLAHDGNRLVRWAAKTRLADPDFKFTRHDGE